MKPRIKKKNQKSCLKPWKNIDQQIVQFICGVLKNPFWHPEKHHPIWHPEVFMGNLNPCGPTVQGNQTQSEGFPTNRRRFREVWTRSTNNTRGGIWCPICFCQVLLPSDLSGWKKEVTLETGVVLVTWIFWVMEKKVTWKLVWFFWVVLKHN